MLKILISANSSISEIAANEFSRLWKQVTGAELSLISSDDPESDLVVIGSDAFNSFSHTKIVEKVIPQFAIASGSDDYQLRSAIDTNGRKLLFIAGGRPRAMLYGVYRFFELRSGCRYFWDGDIVPQAENIDIADLDVVESPRFQYRGLRYFAHRSLNRFQAEHWDFAEWKQEIDWILKKRMNLFMLRIGLDDLFQKAFPETVSYPDGYEVSGSTPRSYDDHTLFWRLEYRAELRKKVLAYARERDLLHPEDIGTMTHWYSRTPDDYLEKVNPEFLPQSTGIYSEKNGLVWDIRQDKNLDAYWKLTETHIREYGSPAIFHTIGLAERRCYADHESNHQMKLYTYRRIQKKLRENYPNAPLLIASWDFCMHWQPEEVRDLIKELDPERTLILDYTSDTDDELRTFQNWDLPGKFPWIFGIFHAYEPNTEPRGNYEAIARRLPIAASDPMCKGLIYWPENSHTDTLLLEFLAANAWNPEKSNTNIDLFIEKFCKDRYAADVCEKMSGFWRTALPLIKARCWNGPGGREGQGLLRYHSYLFSEFFFHIQHYLLASRLDIEYKADYYNRQLGAVISAVPELLRNFAELDFSEQHPFVRRDVFDLIRTVVSRSIGCATARLMQALYDWRHGVDNQEKIEQLFAIIREEEVYSAKIFSASSEHSLYTSLLELNQKQETNPDFENTLKGNAENDYCRTFITELFTELYIPELDVCREIFSESVISGNRKLDEWYDDKRFAAVKDHFYETKLKDIAPDHTSAEKCLADNMRKLADCVERFIKTF